jgi:hypothetical protein
VRRDAAKSRIEDLNAKIHEETIPCNVRFNCSCCKASNRLRTSQDQQSRRQLEAITRHRHAATPDGGNDGGDDEGLLITQEVKLLQAAPWGATSLIGGLRRLSDERVLIESDLSRRLIRGCFHFADALITH